MATRGGRRPGAGRPKGVRDGQGRNAVVDDATRVITAEQRASNLIKVFDAGLERAQRIITEGKDDRAAMSALRSVAGLAVHALERQARREELAAYQAGSDGRPSSAAQTIRDRLAAIKARHDAQIPPADVPELVDANRPAAALSAERGQQAPPPQEGPPMAPTAAQPPKGDLPASHLLSQTIEAARRAVGHRPPPFEDIGVAFESEAGYVVDAVDEPTAPTVADEDRSESTIVDEPPIDPAPQTAPQPEQPRRRHAVRLPSGTIVYASIPDAPAPVPAGVHDIVDKPGQVPFGVPPRRRQEPRTMNEWARSRGFY